MIGPVRGIAWQWSILFYRNERRHQAWASVGKEMGMKQDIHSIIIEWVPLFLFSGDQVALLQLPFQREPLGLGGLGQNRLEFLIRTTNMGEQKGIIGIHRVG